MRRCGLCQQSGTAQQSGAAELPRRRRRPCRPWRRPAARSVAPLLRFSLALLGWLRMHARRQREPALPAASCDGGGVGVSVRSCVAAGAGAGLEPRRVWGGGAGARSAVQRPSGAQVHPPRPRGAAGRVVGRRREAWARLAQPACSHAAMQPRASPAPRPRAAVPRGALGRLHRRQPGLRGAAPMPCRGAARGRGAGSRRRPASSARRPNPPAQIPLPEPCATAHQQVRGAGDCEPYEAAPPAHHRAARGARCARCAQAAAPHRRRRMQGVLRAGACRRAPAACHRCRGCFVANRYTKMLATTTPHGGRCS